MKKTTIYLPETLHHRIELAATRLRISRSEIARNALEEYLDRSERSRRLPPSVGAGANPAVSAADDEKRLERSLLAAAERAWARSSRP